MLVRWWRSTKLPTLKWWSLVSDYELAGPSLEAIWDVGQESFSEYRCFSKGCGYQVAWRFRALSRLDRTSATRLMLTWSFFVLEIMPSLYVHIEATIRSQGAFKVYHFSVNIGVLDFFHLLLSCEGVELESSLQNRWVEAIGNLEAWFAWICHPRGVEKATTNITCFAAGTIGNSILTLVCFTEYSLYVYVNLDVVNPAIERSQV